MRLRDNSFIFSDFAERLGVQKNILLLILATFLISSLYGCSCSQRPGDEPDLTPGLYIGSTSFNEDDDPSQLFLTVKLQRNSTATVTFDYEISASTSDSKPVASVGDANADVSDVVNPNNIDLVFDETTGDTIQIPITLNNDSLYELDEVFTVKLISPNGANIVEGEAEVTIINDDPKPVVRIDLVDESEGYSLEEASLQKKMLKISLNNVSGVDSKMTVVRSSESFNESSTHGLIAAYRIDYLLYRDTSRLPAEGEVIIPAGEQELFIELEAINDGIRENLENFDISLVEGAHVSKVADNRLSFSITDDDTPTSGSVAASALNDTGLLEDLKFVGDSDISSLVAQQDKNMGRDSVEGIPAFSYTKIGSTGDELPDNTDFSNTPWDCVKDNTTGLVWEVKQLADTDLRGVGRHYYWHDPNFQTNGGSEGGRGRYQCELNDSDAGDYCNTAYYVADINANKLCGMGGWRLPTIEELRSIVNYGVTDIHYDSDYFAVDNIGSKYIWTSTTFANSPEYAWAIRFGKNSLEEVPRHKVNDVIPSGVRLVNDSQINGS